MEKVVKIFESKQRKIEKYSKDLFMCRFIVTTLFALAGLTLYLLNFINFPALALIILGALWNFFVDINSMLAFFMCLAVCSIYSLFAIMNGVYISAFLYICFYIPMQFSAWMIYSKEKDISIKKDKKLSAEASYYIIVIMVLVLAITFAFALGGEYQILPLFDSIVACLLGLSAYLQVFMFREYYNIRFIALFSAIILWILVAIINGVTMGALAIILMYFMYLILDIIAMIYWHKTNEVYDKDAIEEIDDEGNKSLVKEKVEEYKELIEKSIEEKGENQDVKA